MSSFKTLLLALSLSVLPSLCMATEAAPDFTDSQKTAIEAVVRNLLTNKEPEIVMKAAEELQKRMEKEGSAKGQAAIAKNHDKIYSDASSPVGGNPKGDVSIVEFFDYTCGYCKMGQATLVKFLAEDKNVRLVYKDFPILGEGSVVASKAALASVAQGKYVALHDALMGSKERLSEEVIKKLAKGVGIDVDKMIKDMESDKIKEILKTNHALAESLHIQGTPAFIIGDKLYPGVLSPEQLKEAVADMRKAKK
ncbi:MAG: DsbA family protein [Bdellovibrionales bacterium]|jgi:protein-disulfide isomerase